MPAIQVNQLSKTYVVPEREAGLSAAFKRLIHRKTREGKAVDQISFTVDEGEIVGFLRPNGAGKTTRAKRTCSDTYPRNGTAIS